MSHPRYYANYEPTPSTTNKLSTPLNKKNRDSNYELHLELYNGRALRIIITMDKLTDLETFISNSTFIKNLFVDGKPATKETYIEYKFENGFLKWKGNINNGLIFDLEDSNLGIRVRGDGNHYEYNHLNIYFNSAHSSRYEVAQLITEIDKQFGIPEEFKLRVQTFCGISLPVISILEIAQSGKHADAIAFATRSYQLEIQLELFKYISTETQNYTLIRECCEILLNNNQFYRRRMENEMIIEIAEFFMKDRANPRFEELSNQLIENRKYNWNVLKVLFNCFIKANMYAQALKCSDYMSECSNDLGQEANHDLGMLLSEAANNPELSQQEKREIKELMLSHMCSSSPKFEEETDKIFASLCGDDTRNPAIKKVGVTVGTLFNTAEHIRRKNEEIASLKAEIETLRKIKSGV